MNLFVYGTLRRACSHPMARFLEERSDYVGPGKVAARLYDVGGVPGIIDPLHADEWVYGDVVHLRDPDNILPVLDKYEGLDPAEPQPWIYERRWTSVVLDSGDAVPAWTYFYLAAVDESKRIMSGRYPKA